MMRFKENNYNRVFVGLSNLIRYICGGDRLRRITKIIDELLKKKHLEKNRKLKILDFGCGSMEVLKKLRDKIYVGKVNEEVVGFVAFNHSKITWLYVHPNHQKKGYGRKLLKFVMIGKLRLLKMLQKHLEAQKKENMQEHLVILESLVLMETRLLRLEEVELL